MSKTDTKTICPCKMHGEYHTTAPFCCSVCPVSLIKTTSHSASSGQGWENEFDEKWEELSTEYENDPSIGDSGTHREYDGDKIKSFIKERFIDRQELEKEIEGMKKLDLNSEDSIWYIKHGPDVYNQALDDILKFIRTKGENA